MFCDLSFNFDNILLLLEINTWINKCNMFLFCVEAVNSLQLETIIEKNTVEKVSPGLILCPIINRNFEGINVCRVLPCIIFTALKTLSTKANVLHKAESKLWVCQNKPDLMLF